LGACGFGDLPDLPPGARNQKVADASIQERLAGTSADECLARGQVWAERQSLTYDSSELARKVESIFANPRFLSVNDELQEEEEVGVQEDEQPSLSSAARHGLFGEMLNAIEPHTEAAPAGVLLAWLACFGNIVGRGAWYPVGPRRHYPALYVGIVGGTSDAKGDGWRSASGRSASSRRSGRPVASVTALAAGKG
jgi:hypothetical protein